MQPRMKEKQVGHDVPGEQVMPLYLQGEDWKVCDGRAWMRSLDQCDLAQGERGVEYIQVRSGDARFVACQPRIQISFGPPPDGRIQ